MPTSSTYLTTVSGLLKIIKTSANFYLWLALIPRKIAYSSLLWNVHTDLYLESQVSIIQDQFSFKPMHKWLFTHPSGWTSLSKFTVANTSGSPWGLKEPMSISRWPPKTISWPPETSNLASCSGKRGTASIRSYNPQQSREGVFSIQCFPTSPQGPVDTQTSRGC